MRFVHAALRSTITLAVLFLSGCIIVKDSPAPGCIERTGFGGLGGCFGKTAILNLMVEPETECLVISANNCNGGVLEVHNDCTEPLVLGEVAISPGDRANLDVAVGNGGPGLVEVNSNFSEYVPEADEAIEILGTLGNQQVSVFFTKTRQLCE